MSARALLSLVVILLTIWPARVEVRTQEPGAPVRVRIRGADRYELPGVLRIDGRRITMGRPGVVLDSDVVRVRLSDLSLDVLRPERSLKGTVLGVNPDGVVSFSPEHSSEVLQIPLAAIGRLHVSIERRESRGTATAQGIGIGVGAFYGVGRLTYAICRCEGRPLSAGMVAGVLTGVIFGGWRGMERWGEEPVEWLMRHFPPAPPAYVHSLPDLKEIGRVFVGQHPEWVTLIW